MSDDLSMDLLRYSSMGFNCSQIVMILILEGMDHENPELIRAMDGLGHGLGHCGETCGCLLGGVAALTLFAGKGSADEEPHPQKDVMVAELVEWFRESACKEYGGISCGTILSDTGGKPDMNRCSLLVSNTYAKIIDMLVEYGFDPSLPKEEQDV
ncbi:DVU_1555 family C-GCAxxG-C-C protein [Desulfovibrio inopinatus]|uniref:DVU_1555 family C-GCAxxG-C-C protein n=1 Tax=Desulfovibrio inopinatus TaxID=102109 RepID=UPI00041BC7F1|nr:DV_1555 family C-GCAxxG-C-C protein [Desulfovibrio inopinatus]